MSPALLTRPPLPKHSLGHGVYKWCQQHIRQPDGPDAGDPWRFTDEQLYFLVCWFGMDERGRWLYSRGVLRRMKGWGKSPFVAALSLAELCGPVRFGGWNPDGTPKGVRVSAAWVQLAGVSEKQTTNTMSMVLAMCAESDIVDEYGLDLGLTRIFTAAGGRLEPITASAPTAEGARPTFVVQDETHHWTESNNGTDMDRVNRRNLGKSRDGAARMLETTNAHASGQQSVAEKSHEAWLAQQEGRTRRQTILYDSREAPAEVDIYDEAELRGGLEAARGDSVWLDIDRNVDEIQDPSTPPEDARRFYLNQICGAVDAWLVQHEWAGRTRADIVVHEQEPIVLGFDGSRRRARGVTDATAIIACAVATGHIFEPLETCVWEQGPADRDWEVPKTVVDLAVDECFRRYPVVGFFADPAKWESYLATWEAKYGSRLLVRASREHPIEWWFTGGRDRQIVRALEQFHTAVIDGELTHDGSYALTRHVLNARRNTTTAGLQIKKEHPESPRKIDAAVAAVLAWQARLAAVAKGVQPVESFVPHRIR